MGRMLTPGEVVDTYGRTARFWRTQAKAGRIAHYRDPDDHRRVYFDSEDIDDFRLRQRVETRTTTGSTRSKREALRLISEKRNRDKIADMCSGSSMTKEYSRGA